MKLADSAKVAPTIPDASGATAYGIFMLAESYLAAARLIAAQPPNGMLTAGPIRLLAYHSCELFLKAYLREQGEDYDRLRSYRHELGGMLEAAVGHGLMPGPQTIAQLTKATAKRDYARVRYVVVEARTDITPRSVIRLAESVREAVRIGLGCDESANP